MVFFTHKKHQGGASTHEIKESFPLEPSLAEMSLGFKIWLGKQYCGGHNLPPPGWNRVNLLNSRWTKAQPGHLLKASLPT